MKEKAVLLVDVSNLYHSLREQNDLPFDAEQFKELIHSLEERFELVDIRFYDAIKNRAKDPQGYAKQQRFHSRLKKAIAGLTIVTHKLRYVLSVPKEKVRDLIKIVDIPLEYLERVYLLLKKLGVVKLTREKGIDVLLVIDALKAVEKHEGITLLILSGDSDYVPLVEFARRKGAKVVNLHTYAGSSKELRDSCDEHILINVSLDGCVELK